MGEWKRIDAYHMRNGTWTIAKCFVEGCTMYVLWHGNECKGYFECAEDAIVDYEEREIQGGELNGG